MDGTPVTVPDEDLSRTVVDVDFPSVVTVDVTFRQRQGGVYNCTVTLKGVNNESNPFTLAANSSLLLVTGNLVSYLLFCIYLL